MLMDFVRNLVEGILAPRRSARRLLDLEPDWQAIGLLFLLGYLIEGVIIGVFAPVQTGVGVGSHVVGLIGSAFGVGVISALAWQFGRMSGGVATFRDMALVICWQQIVFAFLIPFVLPFLVDVTEAMRVMQEAIDSGAEPQAPELGMGAMLPAAAATCLGLWIFASYIAEAHQFKNTLGVLGVIMGMPLALVVLAALVSAG